MTSIVLLIAMLSSQVQAQWIGDHWERSDLELALLKIRNTQVEISITTLNEKERQSLALLSPTSSIEDKARVYSSVALLYSEKGWHGLEIEQKSAEYCEKAAQFPLDAATAGQLYQHWGDSLSIIDHKTVHPSGWDSEVQRKKFATIYLKGLKIVLESLTQDEVVSPPGIMRYDCDGRCPEIEQEHARQMAEHKRISFQNALARERDSLTRSLVGLYFPWDRNPGELKQLSEVVLTNAHADAVQRILKAYSAQKDLRAAALTPHTPKQERFGGVKKATKVKDATSP